MKSFTMDNNQILVKKMTIGRIGDGLVCLTFTKAPVARFLPRSYSSRKTKKKASFS